MGYIAQEAVFRGPVNDKDKALVLVFQDKRLTELLLFFDAFAAGQLDRIGLRTHKLARAGKRAKITRLGKREFFAY